MEALRLLVCSDLHGSQRALDMVRELDAGGGYDLVIVCGDFTTFGSRKYVDRFMKAVATRVLAVPGNCDPPEVVGALEDAGVSIHNRRVAVAGREFFGFGGAAVAGHDMPFEFEEDEIEESLRMIAKPGGVMVTHMPAYGMNDELRSGRRMGSKGILRVAREFRPVLALSGHIHESPGEEREDGTVFVNPGPAGNGYSATVTLGADVLVQLHGQEKHGAARRFRHRSGRG